jgi:hypothetical protein
MGLCHKDSNHSMEEVTTIIHVILKKVTTANYIMFFWLVVDLPL